MSVEDVIIVITIVVLSFSLTRILIPVLSRKSLIDHPNERSSHSVPTPRGGGWAIVLPVLAIMIFMLLADRWASIGWSVFVGALGLSLISWLDDVRSLSVKVRLLAQLFAVVVVVFMTHSSIIGMLNLLPTIVVSAFLVLGWVWFINLYNFMDGIDGITGIETIFICIGIAVVYGVSGIHGPGDMMLPLVIAAGTVGFLYWNWSPARVFMGDVGSVFLGFVLGWLLIQLASAGHWTAAVILPMYYLADASITLIIRVLRGDKFWEPHREHFYQRAHQGGLSHRDVVYRIGFCNLVLLVLAVWSVNGPGIIALLVAACVTGGLLFELSRRQPVS